MQDCKLLVLSLEAAIPLHAHQMAGLSDAAKLRIARHGGEVLACHGDALQFCSSAKRKRKAGSTAKSTAEVFNAVARGLAATQALGHDINQVLASLKGD